MSFTITDAKTLAETWFDEVLDPTMILAWGNEFVQRIVNSKVWKTNRITNSFSLGDPLTIIDVDGSYVIVTADTWYTLPSDFAYSTGVTDSDGFPYRNYTIKNGLIKFANSGPFTLTYIAYPEKITAISGEGNEVPLSDSFLYPLAEFLIFKFYNLEMDDEDSKASANEYEARCNASLKKLYSMMELDSEHESFHPKLRW